MSEDPPDHGGNARIGSPAEIGAEKTEHRANPSPDRLLRGPNLAVREFGPAMHNPPHPNAATNGETHPPRPTEQLRDTCADARAGGHRALPWVRAGNQLLRGLVDEGEIEVGRGGIIRKYGWLRQNSDSGENRRSRRFPTWRSRVSRSHNGQLRGPTGPADGPAPPGTATSGSAMRKQRELRRVLSEAELCEAPNPPTLSDRTS